MADRAACAQRRANLNGTVKLAIDAATLLPLPWRSRYATSYGEANKGTFDLEME